MIETKRCWIRPMTLADQEAIARILQDPIVMTAYEHAFSDDEVSEWINKQLRRYAQDGFGLWAVIRKSDAALIGQCGITLQDCNGCTVHEVGYLFAREYWHQGYATEAAAACCSYAFDVLECREVYAIIREGNTASQAVAKRLGMQAKTHLIKHYYGMDMPHTAYCVQKDAFTGDSLKTR